MTFGKILLLNGPSSSGKTNISRKLTNYGYSIISSDSIKNEILYKYANVNFKNEISLLKKDLGYDKILKILYGFQLKQGNFSEKEIRFIQDFQKVFVSSSSSLIYDEIEIYKRMYNISKEIINSGRSIVLDSSIYNKNLIMRV